MGSLSQVGAEHAHRVPPSPNVVLALQATAGNAAVARSMASRPVRARESLRLQPSLRVGPSSDPLEREADRVAGEIVTERSMPAVDGCECGGSCDHCKVSRATRSGVETGGFEAPPSVHDALARPGRRIDPSTRGPLEGRFGADFSNVRVHVDPVSTAEVGALAYTVGDSVVFDEGRYAPDTSPGLRLLAHELTHVVQQRGTSGTVRRQEGTQERYCPDTPVDDAAVQRHINGALAFATRGGSIDLDVAFAHLRHARESQCCDVNLAAAEHYMWARKEVASGDWSFYMITLVILYDFAKLVHLVPRTGNCPITRASWAQIRWASQGAVDGDMDYYATPRP